MENETSKPENEKKATSDLIIKGRLGSDAKLSESKNDKKPVLTFSVAESIEKDKVKWHNVQVWDKKIPEQTLKKGDEVELKGYLKTFDTSKGPQEEFVANRVTFIQSAPIKVSDTLKGNLGQDPEFKKIGEKNVAAFSIGVKTDKDEKLWQNVQVWDKNIEKNKITELKKGDFVELKGYYGKEYQNKHNENKKDFILQESKLLRHSEKQAEKQTEKPSEKKTEKQAEKIESKKSRGPKI
jgi:single-stranded DNA-binding protein